jgi:hypothetical protein
MPKKLNWKSFESYKDQEEYGVKLFLDMTMGERLERFFAFLELRSELLKKSKASDPTVFNLTK